MTFPGSGFASDAGQSFGTARRNMPSVEYNNTEALREGAENLLGKALDAIAADDEARAQRFITRVCSLPFDEREGYHPGPDVANFLPYVFLADVADLVGPEDAWWVDLVIAHVETLHGVARDALANNLYVLTHEDQYLVPTEAMARVRQLAGQNAAVSYELPLHPDAPLDEKIDMTRKLLDSFHGLTERFAREVEERHVADG